MVPCGYKESIAAECVPSEEVPKQSEQLWPIIRGDKASDAAQDFSQKIISLLHAESKTV